MFRKKSNLYNTRGITSQHVTSDRIPLHGFPLGRNRSEETSQWWRAVGENVFTLIWPEIEPQTPATQTTLLTTTPAAGTTTICLSIQNFFAAVLEIQAVAPNGVIRFYSPSTDRFLAMDDRGRLYGTVSKNIYSFLRSRTNVDHSVLNARYSIVQKPEISLVHLYPQMNYQFVHVLFN